MAFESLTKDLVINYSKNLKEENIPVMVNVTAGTGAISRVISISARASVESITTNVGSAQIEGKIRSDVLVTNIDGGFESLSGTTNFSLPIINQDILATSQMLGSATATNLSNIQASENMVSFTVNVMAQPVLIVAEKSKVLENVSTLAEQKRDTIVYNDIISASSQDFDLNVELDLPNSISKILSIESQCVLKKADAGNDLISLSGEIYCNMIYLTADDEPKLKNHRYMQEFTHELLANGVVSTDNVSATIQNLDSNFELTGEINSTKGTVIFSNKLKANLIVSQSKSEEVVVDAFCPTYMLTNAYNSVTQQSIYNEFFTEKIDGNISLGEDSPRIDKVLAVGEGNVVATEYVSKEGVLSVKGKLLCDVVYKLDTDEGDIESVLAEVPFDLNLKSESLTEKSEISVDIKTRDIDARNKRSKEIDLLAELSISVTVMNNSTDAVLCDVALGEKRQQNSAPFGYYIIPEADTLWEASKMLLVSGKLIMAQNPDLQFPITSPQKIIVYKQKVLD